VFDVIFEADNGGKYLFGKGGNTWFGMSVGNGIAVSLGTAQGFAQVGETVETQSVSGRVVDVTGEIYGRDIPGRKNALRRVCAPFTAGRLIFRGTHYLRVYVKAAPTFSAVRKNGLFKMQFFAPYPFYRTLVEELHYIGAMKAQFRFPVNYAQPHRFGSRAAGRYTNLINSGDVAVPFRVSLRSEGTCSNVVLSNLRTFAMLRLNGTLSAGDQVELWRDEDHVFRAELTREGVKTDILSWVDEASDLFQLEVGDNLISANDDEGGGSLTARFAFSPAVAALYET